MCLLCQFKTHRSSAYSDALSQAPSLRREVLELDWPTFFGRGGPTNNAAARGRLEMEFGLILAGVLAFAGLLGLSPELRRSSPDGQLLWRRPVRTQREDLRLGAAVLLMAATVSALIAAFAVSTPPRANPSDPAAAHSATSARDDDGGWNEESVAAVGLIAVAAGSFARSCSVSASQRLVTYE